MIKSLIADGRGRELLADLEKKDDFPTGLVTYTLPFRETTQRVTYFANELYGSNINQDVSTGGTPENVHNGGDNAYWTASALSGTWDFASTAQAFDGTQSIDMTSTTNNDEALFEDATSIDADNYAVFSGAAYIDSWSGGASAQKNISIRLRNNGVDVGTPILLGSYVDESLLGSWQTFTVPMADFNPAGAVFDEIVIRTIDTGPGQPPSVYLDALAFQETGSSTFVIESQLGSLCYVSSLHIVIAKTLGSGGAATPSVAWDQLCGQTALANGITFRQNKGGEITLDSQFKHHADFMSFPGVVFTAGGSTTSVWNTYTITLDSPFKLDSRTKDRLEIVVSDDLSVYDFLKISAQCGELIIKEI